MSLRGGGGSPLHEAIRRGNKEEVKRILHSNSVLIDSRDNSQQTPLHLACHDRNFELVKLLVSKKASINDQDKNGWTPLHSSANAGDYQSCEFLLQQEGIKVTLANNDGTTVLHYLVRHELPRPDKEENRKLLIMYKNALRLLIEKGAEVNAQTRHGEAPIHQACLKGNRKAVKFLLKHHANVNLGNKLGETALHYAVRCVYKNPSIVALLIDYGADPHIRSKEGTPIDIAPPELVPVLTKANEEVNREAKLLASLVGKQLTVKIVRAALKVEPPFDVEHQFLPDCFVKTVYGSQEFFTPVKFQTLSPRWNESFTCTIVGTEMYMHLIDKRESAEAFGTVFINFKSILPLIASPNSAPHKAAYSIKRSKTGKLSGKLRIQFILTANDRSDDELQPFPKTNRIQSPPTARSAQSQQVNLTSSSESDTPLSSSDSELQSPLSKKPRAKSVVLGYARGRCLKKGCDCEIYVGDSGGGPCKNCGHYPAKHEKASEHPHNSSSSEENPENDFSKILLSNETILGPKPPSENRSPSNKLFNTEELTHSWEIKSDELKFIKSLSEGSTSRVFRGRFREQSVAIKVLKLTGSETKTLEDFKKEFSIMSSLRSPNVVFFYGLVIRPSLCLVLEYCTRGSLFDVLNNPNELITWPRVLKIFSDTVKGLYCLHSWKPQILHRDMKSLNLLVDDNWVTKVSDFGLSRFNSGGQISMQTLTKLRGTLSYTAPEVYFGEKFTPKADVFSLGIIFWECAVRCMMGRYQVPYSEYPQLQFDFQIIIQTAKNGLRPTIPENCPPLVASLLRSCWASKLENRPSTSEILESLQVLQLEYEAHQKEWDELCYQMSSNPQLLRSRFASLSLSSDSLPGGDSIALPIQTLTEEQQRDLDHVPNQFQSLLCTPTSDFFPDGSRCS